MRSRRLFSHHNLLAKVELHDTSQSEVVARVVIFETGQAQPVFSWLHTPVAKSDRPTVVQWAFEFASVIVEELASLGNSRSQLAGGN
jgi:hypothetical protein